MVSGGTLAPHVLNQESIFAFLSHEQETGASADCLRQRKTHVMGLYRWLPEPKLLSWDDLRAWRQSLAYRGFSNETVSNYIKNVNRYLDFVGRSDLRFTQGRAKDLTGQEFGYLTAIAPTDRRDRKDIVWQCRCRCGREVLLPAT